MANEIKTTEPKEKFDGSVSQGGFGSAIAGIVSTNNTQSNIGMQVADGATMRLMDYVGTELGRNPHGDIPTIPGISYTEKLQASYSAQSQVTLGLQAQDAFNAANLELQKKVSLTPDDIMQYQQTMKDVIKDTSELAPHDARKNLEASLNAELSNKVYQNNVRMSQEQRDRKFSHDNVYAHDGMNSMIQANNMGQHDDAFAIMESQIDALTKRFHANEITEEQYTKQVESFNQAYQSSKLTRQLMDVSKNRGSGAVEKLLSEIPNNVPSGMKYADWISSAQQAVTNFNAIESFQAKENAVITTDAFSKVVESAMDLSQQDKELIKSKIPAADYTNLMLKINSYLNPKNASKNKIDGLLLSQNSTLAWQMSSDKDQMGAVAQIASAKMQDSIKRGKPLSQNEALAQAAMQPPVAVNGYKKYVGNMIASGNTQNAFENAVIMQHLKESGSAGTRYQFDPLTEVAALKMLRYSNEMPQNEAVARARDETFTQNSDESKKVQSSYNEWKSKSTMVYLGDSHALPKSQIGDSEYNASPYHDVLSEEFYSLVNDYWHATKGDSQLSLQLATDKIHQNYGFSTVNGKQQYVQHPAEQIIGKDLNGSKYVIVEDARNNVSSQFDKLNQLYETKDPSTKSGYQSDVKIEFIKPIHNGQEVSFEGMTNLFNQYQNETDVPKAKKLLSEYNDYKKSYLEGNDKIAVNVQYRNGRSEPMTAILNASQVMMQEGKKVGDWSVSLVDKMGIPHSAQAVAGYYAQRIYYEGEGEAIKNNIRTLGMTPLNLDNFESGGFYHALGEGVKAVNKMGMP